MRINAEGLHYRELNNRIHAALDDGATEVTVDNVRGQRYLGAGLGPGVRLTLNGVPGNDLAAFMNGAEIVVNANVQDGTGNTMNAGRVIVHGAAGDLLGHSMRAGRIFVRDDVGYRAGIHCKAFERNVPIIVVGTTAGDYLGEYIAGGIVLVLNIGSVAGSPVGRHVGTGMHGGAIYVRGAVERHQLGAEVGLADVEPGEWAELSRLLDEYCAALALDVATCRREDFVRLYPHTSRPYGKLYSY